MIDVRAHYDVMMLVKYWSNDEMLTSGSDLKSKC